MAIRCQSKGREKCLRLYISEGLCYSSAKPKARPILIVPSNYFTITIKKTEVQLCIYKENKPKTVLCTGTFESQWQLLDEINKVSCIRLQWCPSDPCWRQRPEAHIGAA